MSAEKLRELKTLASVCPELNMANYTEDDVRHLNDWAIEMSLLVEKVATSEPVLDVRCEGCGYMTHHREHMGCVRAAKQHTDQAPSVPDDVVRDAERYRWLRDNGVLGFSGAPSWRVSVSFDAMDAYAQTLDSNIDAAMLAAK